jgi:hypothetical protein
LVKINFVSAGRRENMLERAAFTSWAEPTSFYERADAARLDVGDRFFLDREVRHLQEAWVLGKAAMLIGADLVRLAGSDPPDGFVKLADKTIPMEVTELLDEGRRRTDEFKPGGMAHIPIQHVPQVEMDRAAEQNVVWLETRIGAKLAKDNGYPANTVLLIYHNTGLWNFDPERTRAELEAASRLRGRNIIGSIILFGGVAYGKDTISSLRAIR